VPRRCWKRETLCASDHESWWSRPRPPMHALYGVHACTREMLWGSCRAPPLLLTLVDLSLIPTETEHSTVDSTIPSSASWQSTPHCPGGQARSSAAPADAGKRRHTRALSGRRGGSSRRARACHACMHAISASSHRFCPPARTSPEYPVGGWAWTRFEPHPLLHVSPRPAGSASAGKIRCRCPDASDGCPPARRPPLLRGYGLRASCVRAPVTDKPTHNTYTRAPTRRFTSENDCARSSSPRHRGSFAISALAGPPPPPRLSLTMPRCGQYYCWAAPAAATATWQRRWTISRGGQHVWQRA
jgi:hypothetical protein